MPKMEFSLFCDHLTTGDPLELDNKCFLSQNSSHFSFLRTILNERYDEIEPGKSNSFSNALEPRNINLCNRRSIYFQSDVSYFIQKLNDLCYTQQHQTLDDWVSFNG